MRRTAVLLLMMFGVSLGMLSSTPANAITSCDAIVIDSTSKKVLGDTAEIEAAALKLENLGIDVRVRAFDKTPSGGYNAYQKGQVKACPNWQGPGGFTKGNLVTYLFSMDRQSYIFYGSNLEAKLDSQVDRIRADYMNAQFKNGNFSQGIIDAMGETGAVVKAANNPPTKDGSVTIVNEDSSSGGNAFGWVMAAIASLVGIVALGFGFVKLIQLRRRRREELETGRLAAETATQNATTAMTALDVYQDTKRSVDIITPYLNEEDQQHLQALIEKFDALNAQAIEAASAIVDNPTNYSLNKPRKLVEYDRIMAVQDNVIRLAQDAAAVMRQLDEACRQKEWEMQEAPATYAARQATLSELQDLQDRLRGEGYRLDNLDDDFNSITAFLARAQRELDAKRHGHALDELRDSEELLEGIRATLTRVTEWHQGLQKEHGALSEELDQLVTEVVPGALDIRRGIVTQYANCDHDLLSETELNTHVSQTADLLKEAQVEFGMDRQQWEAADQLLSECERTISTIRDGSRVITERYERLAELEGSLQTRIDRLATDIIETIKSAKDREGDQDKFERELGGCEESLAEIRQALEVDKPNLLVIDSDLVTLEGQVAEIENDSKKIHKKEISRREEEERRRRQASYSSSSSSNSFGTGFGAGAITGSVFGSSGGGGHSGGGGGFDSGGSSGGSFGGGDGGSSGGSW